MGSVTEYFQQRFESLFQVPADGLTRPRRWLLRLGQVLYLFARKFHQDLALERASSLAFAATISVIPLGVILFMLFHNFGHFDEQVQSLADLVVERFVAGPEEAAEAGSGVDDEANGGRSEVQEWINGLLSRLRRPLERSAAVTPLALIGLVIAASSLFRTMERSFSAVWNSEASRGYFRRIATFWLMLTAIPIFLGLSFAPDFLAATDSFSIEFVRRTIIPIVVAFFGFVALFTQLPNTRVKVNAAAVGAILSAVVWVLGTQVFTYYIQNWANQSIYGALGVIPFFLVWVYYSWLVALNGCEFAYCVQNFSVLEREVRFHVESQQVSPSVHALFVMERIHRAFKTDEPPPSAVDLAVDFRMPLGEVADLIERLRQAGLIVTDDQQRLIPAKAAENVTLADVVRVFPVRSGLEFPDGIEPGSTALAVVIAEVRDGVDGRLAQTKLSDLAARSNT